VTREFNFDGLAGPTHNYAGLAPGNLHSAASAKSVSRPKCAALEGLEKMRRLHDLGVPQAILPPQERPDVLALRRLGFRGEDEEVLRRAAREAPTLLSAVCSASGMWSANAATVSPSADSSDGRVHITPANLATLFHRSLEPAFVRRVLRAAFPDSHRVVVHDELPPTSALADEGAANHCRLAPGHASPGVQLFVYGRVGITSATPNGDAAADEPRRFTGRQTREASEALARLHMLEVDRTVFAKQSAAAIDAGIFHNDVIAVSNEHVFLYHENAYADQPAVLDELREKYRSLTGQTPALLPVSPDELTLADASDCYLFNSQLVSIPDGRGAMALICPLQCREHPRARRVIDRIIAEDNPIDRAEYVDVGESLRNGGGPACLRLRVVLTDDEAETMSSRLLFSENLENELAAWIRRYYREELRPADLQDPSLVHESRAALDELTQIMDLGEVYWYRLARA